MPTDETGLMAEDTIKHCDTLGMVDGALLRQLVRSARAAHEWKAKAEELLLDYKKTSHSNRMLREENARLKEENIRIIRDTEYLKFENAMFARAVSIGTLKDED